MMNERQSSSHHMTLASTAQVGTLVYCRIVSLSTCYIISRTTRERWRTPLHLQSRMESWLTAGPTYKTSWLLRVSLHFIRKEINFAKSNGWKSNGSNLIEWLLLSSVCRPCTASSPSQILYSREVKRMLTFEKLGPSKCLASSVNQWLKRLTYPQHYYQFSFLSSEFGLSTLHGVVALRFTTPIMQHLIKHLIETNLFMKQSSRRGGTVICRCLACLPIGASSHPLQHHIKVRQMFEERYIWDIQPKPNPTISEKQLWATNCFI